MAEEAQRRSEEARTTPDVSVVIPTKDRPEFLARCLDAVLWQRNSEFEVIVVDDGSASPLQDDAQLGTRLRDSRVRLIRHQESRGVAAARNRGIWLARAPWVAFVDDDDTWAPEKLRLQLDELERHPESRWCYTGEIVMRKDLSVVRVPEVPDPSALAELLIRSNPVPGGGSSVMASTAELRAIGGFDENLAILADWDLWLRLSYRSRPAAVAMPLVGYVRHAAGMSVDSVHSRAELRYLEAKHRQDNGPYGAPKYDRLLYYLYLAGLEFMVGRRLRCVTLCARAVAGAPYRALRLAVSRLGFSTFDRLGGRALQPVDRTSDVTIDLLVEQWRDIGHLETVSDRTDERESAHIPEAARTGSLSTRPAPGGTSVRTTRHILPGSKQSRSA